MFSHRKLVVYHGAVALSADLGNWTTLWDKRHAMVDHLARAAESVVLNLAESARLREVSAKECAIDHAIGSAFECAACLDMARVKRLLSGEASLEGKLRLCEVVKMMIGLRRSWRSDSLREEPIEYQGRSAFNDPVLFGHERLMAYQAALAFVEWLTQMPEESLVRSPLCRRLDHVATSMILNIAEGNGRHARADRRRFLNIAAGSTVKAATYLDLCQRREGLDPEWVEDGLTHLELVARLLVGLLAC